MESSFHIDVPRRFVYWRGSGTASVDEFLAAQATLASRAGFNSTFSCIVDLRFVDLSVLRSDEIRTLSQYSAFGPTAKRVMVMSTAEHYGLGRMYQQFRAMSGQQREALVHVVYTLAAALEWLGLDRDAIPPGLTDEESAAG